MEPKDNDYIEGQITIDEYLESLRDDEQQE